MVRPERGVPLEDRTGSARLFSLRAIQRIARRQWTRNRSPAGTGQIVNEELAFLGRWRNSAWAWSRDGNNGNGMATAVTGVQTILRVRRPSLHLRRFEESDVIVSGRLEPLHRSPIMWQRIMRNRISGNHRPGIRARLKLPWPPRNIIPAPKSDLILL